MGSPVYGKIHYNIYCINIVIVPEFTIKSNFIKVNLHNGTDIYICGKLMQVNCNTLKKQYDLYTIVSRYTSLNIVKLN